MASAYAIKNLMDVEPVGDLEEKGFEGRFSRKYLDSDQLGVSRWSWAPGQRSATGHVHQVQEEAYVVIEGSGRMKLGDDVVEIKRWDVVRVAPTTPRAFEAGPDGLELIAVGGTKPEGGDGSAVEGFWE